MNHQKAKDIFSQKIFLYSKKHKITLTEAIIRFASEKDISYKTIKKCLSESLLNSLKGELIVSGHLELDIHNLEDVFT